MYIIISNLVTWYKFLLEFFELLGSMMVYYIE
jgi:hypothetical protein